MIGVTIFNLKLVLVQILHASLQGEIYDRQTDALLAVGKRQRRRLCAIGTACCFIIASCGTQATESVDSSGQGSAAALALPQTISFGLEALGWGAAGAAILPYAVAASIAAPVLGLAYSTYASKEEQLKYAGYAVARLQLDAVEVTDFSKIKWYYGAMSDARIARENGWLGSLVPVTDLSFSTNFTDTVFPAVLTQVFSQIALNAMSEKSGSSGLEAATAWSNLVVNYAQRHLFEHAQIAAPAAVTLPVVDDGQALQEAVMQVLADATKLAAQTVADRDHLDNVVLVAMEYYGVVAAFFLQGYIAAPQVLRAAAQLVDVKSAVNEKATKAAKKVDDAVDDLEGALANGQVRGKKAVDEQNYSPEVEGQIVIGSIGRSGAIAYDEMEGALKKAENVVSDALAQVEQARKLVGTVRQLNEEFKDILPEGQAVTVPDQVASTASMKAPVLPVGKKAEKVLDDTITALEGAVAQQGTTSIEVDAKKTANQIIEILRNFRKRLDALRSN